MTILFDNLNFRNTVVLFKTICKLNNKQMPNLNGNLKDKSLNYPLLLTIAGSLLFLVFPVFTSPDFNWNFRFVRVGAFQQSFLSYLVALLFFFIHRYWILPRYYFTQQYFIYGIALLLSFFLCVVLPYSILDEGRPPMPFDTGRGPGPAPLLPTQGVFQFLFVVVCSHLLAANSRLRQVRQQQLEAELSYLKAQINPHFLFNSLNSIYALVLKHSADAPKAVVQLSNMMRYALDENPHPYIALSKELDFLEDYIALQSYRTHAGLVFESQIVRPENTALRIAPMVLVSFLENAFKYGVNPECAGKIILSIKVTEAQELDFYCSNKIVVAQPVVSNSRIGLKNTLQRLDSLYGTKYSINIAEDRDQYSVHLKLPLYD